MAPAGGRRPSAVTAAKTPAARIQRADARRNIAAIIDAAQECLIRDPEATVADIAQAAGVGRVTLYGHFATRAELVSAVFGRITAEADAALDATDTSGDPQEALGRLLTASWRIVDQFRSILRAAERELPAEAIREHHDRHLQRLNTLIARGQRSGAFRQDLPRPWLVTTCYGVMHSAAEECTNGRLDPADAGRVVTATLLAALSAPGSTVP
jgi:TetR/AcrR family transcriptional repressor of mexCD-oprJ operon